MRWFELIFSSFNDLIGWEHVEGLFIWGFIQLIMSRFQNLWTQCEEWPGVLSIYCDSRGCFSLDFAYRRESNRSRGHLEKEFALSTSSVAMHLPLYISRDDNLGLSTMAIVGFSIRLAILPHALISRVRWTLIILRWLDEALNLFQVSKAANQRWFRRH